MLSETDASRTIGATAYGSDGDKIGKIGELFLDDQTGRPEFLSINTGLFGTSESFVPAHSATLDGDKVTVAYTKDQVKDAPNVDLADGHLEPEDEQRLFDYYGQGSQPAAAPVGTGGEHDVREDRSETTVGHDTSGPTTDDAMTLSEEKLQAGTRTQEAGRARLRKYVTTEEQTVTVPVRKEHATLEREPITDANRGAAQDGPGISEEEHEVTLSEEVPVVSTTTEAVERVRLGTETTTENETVSGEVRKENVDVDGEIEDRR